MWLRLFLAALLVSLVRGVVPAGASETLLLSADGLERRILIERPEQSQHRPLLIILHGNGQVAEDMRDRFNWRDLVEQDKVIVAFPQGLNQAWADGRAPEAFLGKKPMAGVDDVAFLSALVRKLVEEGQVDPRRVYASGLSNGGLMTYRLICERPDVFAGGAVISASFSPWLVDHCHPGAARPLLMMNGTADRVIPYTQTAEGSIKTGAVHTIGTEQTIDWWRSNNGCVNEMRRDDLPDVDRSDHSTVIRYTWKCPAGRGLELYRIEGGGHRVPALAATLEKAALDPHANGQNLDIDTAREIWAFFSQEERGAAAQRLGSSAQ